MRLSLCVCLVRTLYTTCYCLSLCVCLVRTLYTTCDRLSLCVCPVRTLYTTCDRLSLCVCVCSELYTQHVTDRCYGVLSLSLCGSKYKLSDVSLGACPRDNLAADEDAKKPTKPNQVQDLLRLILFNKALQSYSLSNVSISFEKSFL